MWAYKDKKGTNWSSYAWHNGADDNTKVDNRYCVDEAPCGDLGAVLTKQYGEYVSSISEPIAYAILAYRNAMFPK